MSQSKEIVAFLAHYPPFSKLPSAALLGMADASTVVPYPRGHCFFKKNESAKDVLFVVKTGAVDILLDEHEEVYMLDRCDEGDLFGARPLLADSVYLAKAVAHEDCHIIEIPFTVLGQLLESNAQLALFFAASYASGQRNPADRSKPGALIGKDNRSQPTVSSSFLGIQTVEPNRALVRIHKQATIQEAAQKMQQKQVGSILITNEAVHPIGILTDRDLRNKVVALGTSTEAAVESIMSSPVKTIAPQPTIMQVQALMFQKSIRHICITEDGTDSSPALGILSQQDLLVAQGRSPASLIRQLRKAEGVEQLQLLRARADDILKNYLEKDVAIEYTAQILSAINEALLTRVIELSVIELHAETGTRLDESQFCWLGLGSEGRQEQLLRTDQDNALIFIEKNTQHVEAERQVYLVFARKVTAMLNACGFEFCPGDMMARNPKWCLSVREWKHIFSTWMHKPSPASILNTSVFFDFRPLYGYAALAEQLTAHIFEELDKREIFLSFLAKNAMQNPPPVGFFRNILLERNGEHKNQFDVKGRAMLPLADAARVLVLHRRIAQVNNTPARYRALAAVEPQNTELFIQAAESYEVLMRYRAEHGLKNGDGGRFFKLEALTKLERMTLRNCFEPINDLQKLMTTRFQLAYFS